MQGDFGAIFQHNKQVGGFLDWRMSFELVEANYNPIGFKSYAVTKWRLIASPYYWVADTKSDEYTVDLYKLYLDELVLLSRNQVIIDRNLSEKTNSWHDKRLEVKLA